MIFGVDYYPEQWEEKDYEEDLRIIKDMGADMVRLGEFSWILLEPSMGNYDFSFLYKILNLADKFNLKVVLGTPTATPPPYLLNRYPEICSMDSHGNLRGIGIRRQASLSSPVYLERVTGLVEKMGENFGKLPMVIGWQIDNEPGHEGSDLDFSPNARAEFHNWLRDKYSDIENLNKTWGTIFWSQVFLSFEEIPLPIYTTSTGFHPALIQDFFRFSSDVLQRFINTQTNILKKHSSNKFITTNLYPTPFGNIIDMFDVFQNLDFVSFDNYPVWGGETKPRNFLEVLGHLQYIKGLKSKNFTILEQISGMQGHTIMGYLPPNGQLKNWIIQAIGNGAEKIFFFRYRTARFGQEQLCFGILDHDKKPTERYYEIKDTIKFVNENLREFISGTKDSKICIIHSPENNRNFKHQPLLGGLTKKINHFLDSGYDDEFFHFFTPFKKLGLNPEIIPENYPDLKKYEMIVLPLYSMVNEITLEKLYEFVYDGGILVLNYRTGFKDKNSRAFDDCIPGPFKDLAGVESRKFDCVDKDYILDIKFSKYKLKGRFIAEILTPTTGEIIGTYTNKNKSYKGLGAISRNYYGKGTVYYSGTSLKNKSLKYFYRYILDEHKIPYKNLKKGIEIFSSNYEGKKIELSLNHSTMKIKIKQI